MYLIDDSVSAIREVQRMLLIIAEVENSIPEVSVDGIYGDTTADAVLEYQRLRSLAASGVVNEETFNLLFFESEGIIDERNTRNNTVRYEQFPLVLGDAGENVRRLNTELLSLVRFYPDMPLADIRGFFGRATEGAVKYFQRILRVDEDGKVSAELFERIRREVLEREKFVSRA